MWYWTMRTALAQPYNWSISDQSPLIAYTPLFRGDKTTTWNSTYSLSSWSDYGIAGYLALVGRGRSAHISTAPSATAKVGFNGTAVYVWGEAFQLSAVIFVDGVSRGFSSGDSGQIGAVIDLSDGWHDVEVIVRGLADVQLEGFTFTSELDA